MLKDFNRRPLISRLMFLSAFLAVIIISGQGCYTMIKHPKVEEAELHAEEAGTRCLECHANLAEYPFGYDPVGFPHYWDYWENYELYYTYPWWWEDYFWDTGSGSSGAVYRDPAEPPERRRGIISPYPDDNDLPPAGITPPGSESGGSGGQASGTKDGKYRGDNKSDDKNSGDKKDSGSGKKEKPERRRTPK